MPRVPILCYHRIEAPPASRVGDQSFVTPELFERHVAALARLGYTGVSVADVVRWQRGEGRLPARAIAFTFDDGYESVLTHAVPTLRRRGWSGSVFVVSREVGGTNAWDPNAPPARMLDEAGLRTLVAEGFEIGSHTRHHKRVTTLGEAEVEPELAGSRRDLEDLVGRRVESFAFPYGTHNTAALYRVAATGYRAAVTLKRWANGRSTNPLRLGRASIGGRVSPTLLLAKVAKMYLTPSRA
jgi:peptidoglycan/xylan/chitin deacetylase (PgdA/CDA1 family)